MSERTSLPSSINTGALPLWLWTLITLVALAAWGLASLAVASQSLLPSPAWVFQRSVPEIALFGGGLRPSYVGAVAVLCSHIAVSLLRASIGFSIGLVAGASLAAIAHSAPRSRPGTEISLAIARGIPLFALIPLFLYWFSSGPVAVVTYISVAVALVAATGVYEAVRNVDRDLPLHARLLGITGWRLAVRVYLPAILPELQGTVANAAGLVWAFSLGAEYLAGESGLGFLVFQSYLNADMGKLFVFAILYMVVGLGSTSLARRGMRRLTRWSWANREKST